MTHSIHINHFTTHVLFSINTIQFKSQFNHIKAHCSHVTTTHLLVFICFRYFLTIYTVLSRKWHLHYTNLLTFHSLSCSYAIITVLSSHKTAHNISAQAQQYNNRHTTCNRQQCVQNTPMQGSQRKHATRSKSPTTPCKQH